MRPSLADWVSLALTSVLASVFSVGVSSFFDNNLKSGFDLKASEILILDIRLNGFGCVARSSPLIGFLGEGKD